MDAPPQLVGNNNKRQKVEKKENESKIVMEEVSQLDMETKRPIEETVYQPDIKDISLSEKIFLGKKAIKQNISDKQRATLAKARTVLAEKRRLQKSTPPSGTPAPDILSKVQNMFENKFEYVNKKLDDLQKIIAYESPLQVNHQVPMSATHQMETIENQTILNIQNEKPYTNENFFQYKPFAKQLQNSKTAEISKAMKSVPFTNEKVWDRIKQDSTLTSNPKSQSIFMF